MYDDTKVIGEYIENEKEQKQRAGSAFDDDFYKKYSDTIKAKNLARAYGTYTEEKA